MSGEMMLSFPAGIVTVLANNPNPAKLSFKVKNTLRLSSVLPNKQLVAMWVFSFFFALCVFGNDGLIFILVTVDKRVLIVQLLNLICRR